MQSIGDKIMKEACLYSRLSRLNFVINYETVVCLRSSVEPQIFRNLLVELEPPRNIQEFVGKAGTTAQYSGICQIYDFSTFS